SGHEPDGQAAWRERIRVETDVGPRLFLDHAQAEPCRDERRRQLHVVGDGLAYAEQPKCADQQRTKERLRNEGRGHQGSDEKQQPPGRSERPGGCEEDLPHYAFCFLGVAIAAAISAFTASSGTNGVIPSSMARLNDWLMIVS